MATGEFKQNTQPIINNSYVNYPSVPSYLLKLKNMAKLITDYHRNTYDYKYLSCTCTI